MIDDFDDFSEEVQDVDLSFSKVTAREIESIALAVIGQAEEVIGQEERAIGSSIHSAAKKQTLEMIAFVGSAIRKTLDEQDVFCTNSKLINQYAEDGIKESIKKNALQEGSPEEEGKIILGAEEFAKLPERVLTRLTKVHVLKQKGANGDLEDISPEKLENLQTSLSEKLAKKFKDSGWVSDVPLSQNKEEKESHAKVDDRTYTLMPKQDKPEEKARYHLQGELPSNIPTSFKITLLSQEFGLAQIRDKDKEKRTEEERDRIYEQIIYREIIRDIKKFDLKRQGLNESIVKAYHLALETQRYLVPMASVAA